MRVLSGCDDFAASARRRSSGRAAAPSRWPRPWASRVSHQNPESRIDRAGCCSSSYSSKCGILCDDPTYLQFVSPEFRILCDDPTYPALVAALQLAPKSGQNSESERVTWLVQEFAAVWSAVWSLSLYKIWFQLSLSIDMVVLRIASLSIEKNIDHVLRLRHPQAPKTYPSPRRNPSWAIGRGPSSDFGRFGVLESDFEAIFARCWTSRGSKNIDLLQLSS